MTEGEVVVLNEMDNRTPYRRISMTQEVILADDDGVDGDEPAWVPSQGCFGQSVLLGRRRSHTYVSFQGCECMIVSKDDLEVLLESSPYMARLLCRTVLKDQEVQDKIRSLMRKLRIATMARNEERAALVIQLCLDRFNERRAAREDPVYKLVFESQNEAETQKKKEAEAAAPPPPELSDAVEAIGEVKGMLVDLCTRMERMEKLMETQAPSRSPRGSPFSLGGQKV